MWGNKLSFEGMSGKVTLQRLWEQRSKKDWGYFCNLFTLRALIVNEASALFLYPQQVILLDPSTVYGRVGASLGLALYLEYLWVGWWNGASPRKPHSQELRK